MRPRAPLLISCLPIALLGTLLLGACAPVDVRPEPPETRVTAPTGDTGRERIARDLEAKGDLTRARIQWEALRLRFPDNPDYRRERTRLAERVRTGADRHMRTAREAWERDDVEAAELHWLKALALDPGRQEAHEMLREVSRLEMMEIQAARIAKIKAARERRAKKAAEARAETEAKKAAPSLSTTPSKTTSPAPGAGTSKPGLGKEELAERKARAQALYEDGLRKYRTDLPEAIRLLEECLELDPEHRQAKMQLQRAYRMRETLNRIQEY